MKLSGFLCVLLLCVSCHSHHDAIANSELAATAFRQAATQAFRNLQFTYNETISIYRTQPANIPISCDSSSMQPSHGISTVTIIRHRQARAAVTESSTSADTARTVATASGKVEQSADRALVRKNGRLSPLRTIFEALKVFLIILLLYALFRFSLNHRS
jgi:hypothetical protein